MNKRLQDKLDKRRAEGTLRSLSLFKDKIDFVSNDYLGLSKYQPKEGRGSTGSRLISGTHQIILNAEEDLAKFFQAEAALCFNSGYDANLGFFSTIPQKGDVVLYDEDIHASVRDGLRLSTASSYSFRHNDLKDLERKLIKYKDGQVFVATEGLFSMKGDLSRLDEIKALVQKFDNVVLVLDEAHSAGIYGDSGIGVLNQVANNEVKLVTYGKAYGGHGAVVLSSNLVKQYLINFCRPFIYTTALNTGAYLRMAEVVKLNELEQERMMLLNNIEYFLSKLNSKTISDVKSPIQIIRGEKEELLEIQSRLEHANIASKIIFAPTVKDGDECIRICIHSNNTKAEIDSLISILNA